MLRMVIPQRKLHFPTSPLRKVDLGVLIQAPGGSTLGYPGVLGRLSHSLGFQIYKPLQVVYQVFEPQLGPGTR